MVPHVLGRATLVGIQKGFVTSILPPVMMLGVDAVKVPGVAVSVSTAVSTPVVVTPATAVEVGMVTVAPVCMPVPITVRTPFAKLAVALLIVDVQVGCGVQGGQGGQMIGSGHGGQIGVG